VTQHEKIGLRLLIFVLLPGLSVIYGLRFRLIGEHVLLVSRLLVAYSVIATFVVSYSTGGRIRFEKGESPWRAIIIGMIIIVILLLILIPAAQHLRELGNGDQHSANQLRQNATMPAD
jgi:hypothetical protein